MNYTELSKRISYILRHNPHEYGLLLDKGGWVDLEALISALKVLEQYKKLDVADIENMMIHTSKKRHEIHMGRIRALYGHTLKERIEKKPAQPPEILFHGTSRASAEKIFKEGLSSKGRQYVHLSPEKKTAYIVGKRKDNNPIVLVIDAKYAWSAGILFYPGNEYTWLSESIPAKFIREC